MGKTLAEALWAARTSGQVVEVEAGRAPASIAAAYDVQAAITRAAGLAQVGWKLGATTTAAQDLLAIDQPFIGPLFARHCHPNGAEVALVAAQNPGLESEFLVGLEADLPARERPYEAGEVAAAVAFIAPAFEIVGARFAGGLAGNGLLAIADGGGNIAVVQGEPVADWRRFDLGDHAVNLRLNGTGVVSGNSSVLMFGAPIGALVWLAGQPLLAERGLKRGDIVMTGTCTGLTPIKAGDTAVADFGELGQVRASFV
jgi:2-keto-4-pentenoate hydratase